MPRPSANIARIEGNFKEKDIISIDQFDPADIDMLIEEANAMKAMVSKQGRSDLLADKIVADLFYEPSTRTFISFEGAAKRLSADTVATQGVDTSSMVKGETIADTVRVAECSADIIVIRHQLAGAATIAAEYASVPVINGGDGVGEHPTQALLDFMTLKENTQKKPEDLTVTLMGDLAYGRTGHSFALLLAKYGIKLNYVAPEHLEMPRDLVEKLNKLGIEQYETDSLDEVLQQTDALYVTRIQKERIAPEVLAKIGDNFVIDEKVMARAPKDMLLMHPLPRVGEIDEKLDSDPRAKYFEQVQNGVYIRMALLALISGRSIRS